MIRSLSRSLARLSLSDWDLLLIGQLASEHVPNEREHVEALCQKPALFFIYLLLYLHIHPVWAISTNLNAVGLLFLPGGPGWLLHRTRPAPGTEEGLHTAFMWFSHMPMDYMNGVFLRPCMNVREPERGERT